MLFDLSVFECRERCLIEFDLYATDPRKLNEYERVLKTGTIEFNFLKPDFAEALMATYDPLLNAGIAYVERIDGVSAGVVGCKADRLAFWVLPIEVL